MGKSHTGSEVSFILLPLFLVLFVDACAEFRLNTIPAPPPTAQLKVFVQRL